MLLSFARKIALCCGLVVGIPGVVSGQTANYYTTHGTEYAIGLLPGDQVWPDVAVTPSGGFVIWQDNITDGGGWGIKATRLDSTLSAVPSWTDQRVSVQGTNDQENARVALLKNGGAVFVWQGGQKGFQHIYAQFLSSTNTFLTTTDVMVSTFTNNFQINPTVATLTNGNVIVVWSSFDQAGPNSLQDVYGQILSPTGQKIGVEFLVNQCTAYNQRSPVVAALKNGGFVVAWVSEQERQPATLTDTTNSAAVFMATTTPSVDIYARLYNGSGVAQGTNEFLVNTDSNPCANPSVAAGSDGSFMVAWSEKDMVVTDNSWDIYARSFSSAGVGGTAVRVNTHTYGDQYAPRISSIGTDYLIVWTSLGQDGSREGVFGQFVRTDMSPTGGEFCVNTTTLGPQMQPAVASDGAGQFLVVWTSFTFGPTSMDLFVQRYANVSAILQPMAAPFVYAPFTLITNALNTNGVYQPQLVVSWPPVQGLSISTYEVYVDGAVTPMAIVTTNVWTMTAANRLTTSSSNFFQVDYVTTDGRTSPISPSAGGMTWSGYNWKGIPFEWMTQYYGSDVSQWPANVNTPLVSGGPTLYQIFLSGGNPLDSTTWLRMQISQTPQGLTMNLSGVTQAQMYLNIYGLQQGRIYQLQWTTDFVTWSPYPQYEQFVATELNTARSIPLTSGSVGYYRILLLRQ